MEHKFIDLYDDYNDGLLDRREFLIKLAIIAGGTAAANTLLPFLENNYAMAEIVSKDDPRIQSENISYPGATGDINAHFVMPKGNKKIPGVIVIHEIWGLNPHIEDVARRLALEGFMAIAPDALTPLGGTPDDPSVARPMFRKLNNQSTVKNYMAAQKYLQNHPVSNGNVGVIGFCWGGGMANQLAVNSPDLKAAAPFYGSQPTAEDVPKIKASLLLHYAENDNRINAGIPAFEEALKKTSIDFQMHSYKGASHAFHNDTNASRYNKEAAQLAWKRSIEFFKEKLKT